MPDRLTYTVEWVDTATIFFAARKAIRKASAEGVEMGNAPLDVQKELDAGLLDWAEPETCISTRNFPNLGMAKGWAMKHRELDLWGEPRVFVTQTFDVAPWRMTETETLEEWRFDGGDELLKCAP